MICWLLVCYCCLVFCVVFGFRLFDVVGFDGAVLF